jgi:hypothetical protein|tara:strand:+ start:562 stop:927 length:366 start_codon:yes stop_codon:yes gene_type:complete
MSKRTQALTAAGSANGTVLDGGITSTEDEKIHLLGVYVSVDQLAGNTIEGWIGQTRHVEIYDYNLRSHAASGSNQYPDVTATHYLPIDRPLEVGKTFKLGMKCGGTATDIFGAYEFEVVGD